MLLSEETSQWFQQGHTTQAQICHKQLDCWFQSKREHRGERSQLLLLVCLWKDLIGGPETWRPLAGWIWWICSYCYRLPVGCRATSAGLSWTSTVRSRSLRPPRPLSSWRAMGPLLRSSAFASTCFLFGCNSWNTRKHRHAHTHKVKTFGLPPALRPCHNLQIRRLSNLSTANVRQALHSVTGTLCNFSLVIWVIEINTSLLVVLDLNPFLEKD